jgi:hypothetical protein
MISNFLPKLNKSYFSILKSKCDNNTFWAEKEEDFSFIYSTTSVFVSVLIRYTSSLIQPSCSTKMNIHRPHRTQVYNSVVVTFNYRGFFRLLAPCQCVPHVTCSYLIIMHILHINSAEQNAQYRSVNEHKSIRQLDSL